MFYQRPSIAAIFVLLSFTPVLAQNVTCPDIVKAALNAADQACDGLQRDYVCYGNITLQVEPISDDELVFESPGDMVAISDIQSLQLSSMNAANGEWGVAEMLIRATVPDTLPNQGIIFILFGDVAVRTTLEGDTPVVPTSPPPTATPVQFQITASGNINVRGGPSQNHPIIDSLTGGENAIADGRNAAGDWIHIQLSDGDGWVFAAIVTTDSDITALPVVEMNSDVAPDSSITTFEATQAFYFTTGFNDRPCHEAPDSGILIQTPQGIGTIQFVANGVEIAMASTLYVQAQPNNEMVINVVEGLATVSALGTSVVSPAGMRVRVPLDAAGIASGAPIGPEPYDGVLLGALPVGNLPTVVEIAPALTALLVAGEYQVTGRTSGSARCEGDIALQTISFDFAFADDNQILMWSGTNDRVFSLTRTEVGTYVNEAEPLRPTIEIVSPTHFIMTTLPGENICGFYLDGTLLTPLPTEAE